jgi:hypothetical protein
MKLLKSILPIVLVLTLIVGGGVFADEKKEVKETHWVYDELADFKQRIFPIVSSINNHEHKTITKEEWMSVYANVLNDEKLDEPIQIYHWTALIKMVLGLPEDQTNQLLDMYAYQLAMGNEILREDAVGGLVKLLTIDYISGSSTADDLKGSEALKDLEQISEKQKTLVQMAYVEGILDGTTIGHFRPKDKLTNAEAISILYRVIKKYDTLYVKTLIWPQSHWSVFEVEAHLEKVKPRGELLNLISNLIKGNNKDGESQNNLNKPINIKDWNDLLEITLDLEHSKYKRSDRETYTYGLSESGHITRDKAVAGIMKLLIVADVKSGKDISRDAYHDEQVAAASAFIDFDQVWDKSKFSIAYSEGLIFGSEERKFYPNKLLTNAEAMVLIARIAKKYYY